MFRNLGLGFGRGLVGLALLLVACGDAARHGKLLDGSAPSLSEEAERLRRMQLLRVVAPNGDTADIFISEAFFDEPVAESRNGFGDVLFENCFRSDQFDTKAYNERIQRFKCMGDLLLGMATDPGSVTLNVSDRAAASVKSQMPQRCSVAPDGKCSDAQSSIVAGTYKVLPQKPATNARLAQAAADYYATTIRNIAKYVTKPPYVDLSNDGLTGRSTAEEYGSIFVDSYHSGKEAYQVAVQSTLAVADAELASTPSLQLARRRAITNPALSRMAAAHLLVGGKAGFLGSQTDAFCTTGRLSGPQQAALALFREAGVAPADVLNPSLATRALVNGPDPIPGQKNRAGEFPSLGSVKARLGDAWGQKLAANQDVFTLYSLNESDFDAAREQLKSEIGIWSRSRTATLAPRPAINGVEPKYARFAGTATVPTSRDPWYWTGLAQTDSSSPTAIPTDGWYVFGDPSTRQSGSSYVDFVNFAIESAEALLADSHVAAKADDSVQLGFRDPLATLLGKGDRAGRLSMCSDDTTVYASLVGLTADDGARTVLGDDDMACAVTGTVDGAPCSLDGRVGAATQVGYDYGRQRPDAEALNYTAPVTGLSKLAGQRFYVIKPRSKGNTTARPGGWEVVVSAPIYLMTNRCRDTLIVPEATQKVAEVMAPNPKWCGQSLYSCAGGSFDERLPLEDELTNDQDGVESSWKHYLSLARDAAVESDRLGEEYINSAVAVDQRNEELSLRAQQQQEKAAAELETLQDICGTAVDPGPLLKALGSNTKGDFDLNNIDHGPCTGNPPTVLPTDPAPPPGTVCRGGRAVLDWLKLSKDEPQLKDLANCVATFADTTTTTFGDQDVCAWKDTAGTVCGGAGLVTEGFACPDIKRNSKCLFPLGATPVVLAKEEDALKLFSTVDTLAPPPQRSLCDSIRELRKNPASANNDQTAKLNKLVESNHFDAPLLAPLRKRLEFQATLGGYADINVDGKRAFTTGNVRSGASDKWPCTPTGKPASCGSGSGLFCFVGDCKNPAGLQVLAERMFKAVAAAQLSSYAGGDDPKIPVWRPLYLKHSASPRRGLPSDVRWDTTPEATPGNPNPTPTTAPFILTSNDAWQLLTGDITSVNDSLGNPHDLNPYSWFGRVWKLQTGDRRFAFGHTAPFSWGTETTVLGDGPIPVDPPMMRAKFWGGLSLGQDGNGAKDFKFLYRVLAIGADSGVANPGYGVSVAYGRDVLVDEGCSASCRLSPECRCSASDSHTANVDNALKDWQLETSNPDGNPITFSDVSPLTYDFDSSDSSAQSLLDGLELMCEVSEGFGDRATGCDLENPPKFNSFDDLSANGSYIQCVGDKLTNSVALSTISDFPRAALDPLKANIASPKGQIGTAISDLRSALIRVALAGPTIARTTRDFGLDMKRLRESFAIYNVDDQIASVQFQSTVMEQSTACVAKAADEVGRVKNLVTFGVPAGIATAATCLNSIAQIGFASKLEDLKNDQTQSQRQLAVIDFNERFSAHSETLEKQALEMAGASEDVQKQLGIIEDLHAKAQRSVDKALWYLSRQAANQAEVSSVLLGRSKTAQLRYFRAFDNAKRLAFLAGRAIEQRLGVNLAEMTQRLPLVGAPATWATTICDTSGINYAKLRGSSPSGTGGTSGTAGSSSYNFADSYIGDYVTKLANVVESYQLTQNFHEGTDTAVVSLRDDVFNLRQDCDVDSTNRLYWASRLDKLALASTDLQRVGWTAEGCGVEAGQALPNCITVTQHKGAPFVDLRPQLRSVPGYVVQFGTASCDPATCGYRDGASLVQTLTLEPGRYRFSWYTPEGDGSASALSGLARSEAGDVTRLSQSSPSVPANAPGWRRPYFLFDVKNTGDYEVGFKKPKGTAIEINVGAPMLERVDSNPGETSTDLPKMFSNTTDVRTSRLAVCQDTDGSVFRQKEWTRGCTFLCPDGYSSDCSDRSKQACYWETSVHISQREIEAGHQFKVSGFARGNFNYRIDSLGLNFVGTGLRACGDSETPSACYSGGFIPYSIIHGGPYFVRNHEGLDYEAKLFTGAIEHARGLATERYISNPMSEADHSLIQSYLRQELQGRPLDGDLLVRVWDEQGVAFNKIEDVQLVLNYRYWTRFN